MADLRSSRKQNNEGDLSGNLIPGQNPANRRNDMISSQFKKEAFKQSVKDNVKYLYRKTLDEATQEQIFQAVSYTVKDVIIDNWL